MGALIGQGADMALKAHLQAGESAETGARTSPRRALRLVTSGRLGDGAAANVTIHNLSAAGLLLETALELAVGEELTLDLPEAGPVDAVIVWRSEQLYGCAFAEALGRAALAAATLKSLPSAGEPARAMAAVREPLGGTFGQKLNRLRRERGLTLADVATALGVSKPTVWAWEKGKARPVPERLDAIAQVLGIAPEALRETGALGTEAHAVIEECRLRLSSALGCAPDAVRIMIEF
ncbi:MAG: helix-turn-helix domain-containing protein [Erythrobacter sp.]